MFRGMMDEKEVAERLAISIHTLRKWRSLGKRGLPYYKIGRSVRYSRTDVSDYLSKSCEGVSDGGH